VSSGPRYRLRAWWERRKAKAFPPGAVTFHLVAWRGAALVGPNLEQARAFFARFSPEELLVLHGSALEAATGVTLVCGPAGVGKSSILTELEARGVGRLIEDGILLVARRQGRWELASTGVTEVMRRAARISKRLRRLLRADFSVWQAADSAAVWRARPLRTTLLRDWIPRLSFSAACLWRWSGAVPFELALRPVDGLILLYHAEDPWLAARVSPQLVVENVENLGKLVPDSVRLVQVSPIGGMVEVRDRLRQAVSAASRGPSSAC